MFAIADQTAKQNWLTYLVKKQQQNFNSTGNTGHLIPVGVTLPFNNNINLGNAGHSRKYIIW